MGSLFLCGFQYINILHILYINCQLPYGAWDKTGPRKAVLFFYIKMMMGFEPTISVLQTDALPLGHIIIIRYKVLDGI